MICLSAISNCGKSGSLRQLFYDAPESGRTLIEEIDDDDFVGTFTVAEKKVGIVSRDDMPELIERDMKLLPDDCDFIVSAAHSRGNTCDMVEKIAHEKGYQLVWVSPLYADIHSQFDDIVYSQCHKRNADFVKQITTELINF